MRGVVHVHDASVVDAQLSYYDVVDGCSDLQWKDATGVYSSSDCLNEELLAKQVFLSLFFLAFIDTQLDKTLQDLYSTCSDCIGQLAHHWELVAHGTV